MAIMGPLLERAPDRSGRADGASSTSGGFGCIQTDHRESLSVGQCVGGDEESVGRPEEIDRDVFCGFFGL